MADAAGLAVVKALVVGTDGSSAAAEALAWALEESHRRRVPLHVASPTSP